VILDLEDAIPPDFKHAAREGLPGVIETLAKQGCQVVVRINAEWRSVVAELEAAMRPGVAAIMVPKVEGATRLFALSEMLSETILSAGLDEAPGIIALVESPAGLAEIEQIAKVPGIVGLALGSEDFSLSMGVPPTPAVLDLPCRRMAWEAARHGIMALGLPVSIATISDEDAWKEGVRAARSIGMTGALCIHPRQIAAANEGFAPSSAEVEHARRILAAWAEAAGAGVIQMDGKMIDRPVVLAAERVVSCTMRRA
jgi:citrate lyase subunit beta/citryl-CoA lyase